jgi:hypothetical protein
MKLFGFIGTASQKKHSIELQDSIFKGFLISFEGSELYETFSLISGQ